MVQKELPASVYRCKGIFYSIEDPTKRFALQMVGRRIEINELDAWDEQTPYSKIVAIGDAEKIDPDALMALFDGCSAESEQHSLPQLP
jgi:G3E family GTPase